MILRVLRLFLDIARDIVLYALMSGRAGSSLDSQSAFDDRRFSLMTSLFSKYWLGSSIKGLHSASDQALTSLLGELCPVAAYIQYKRRALSSGLEVNFIEITSPRATTSKPRTLVLTHGYASGLGFFFNNYERLAMKFDRIIAVDWPGMGSSSRYTTASGSKPPQRSVLLSMLSASLGAVVRITPLLPNGQKERLSQRIEESLVGSGDTAAAFFVNALDEFIEKEVPTGKFTLAGHSLGGYLSAQYALTAVNRIEGLVLISPAGLHRQPARGDRLSFFQHSVFLSAAKLFWALNVTPQIFVRLYGSGGPDMVRNTLQQRFNGRFTQPELIAISRYFHSITVLPAHSEVSLNALLLPVAYKIPAGAPDPRGRGYSISLYARSPIWVDKRLPRIKSLPVLLLYGDDDWLSYSGVEADVEELNRQGMQVELGRVQGAGHHLYLDNVKLFHDILDSWLDRKVLCNR